MKRLVASFESLLQASEQLHLDAPTPETLARIVEQKLFRPADNERLGYWYGQYLSIRQELWDLISECLSKDDRTTNNLADHQLWSYFIVGYSSACLLIRNDRLFLFEIATHSVVQRKFNEAFPEFRIPRKLYTKIFSAFIDGHDTLRIFNAIRNANRNRKILEQLREDPVVGSIATQLPRYETWLDVSKRNYLIRLIDYLSHKWRRKSVVALNNSLFSIAERLGRTASELQLPLEKRVDAALRRQMASELIPGDILVTRHDTALTNLFLPGFWPHAALFVGNEHQRTTMNIQVEPERAARWSGDICVLEALKDGVHFRPITETLAVDNFVVIRPNLTQAQIAKAIQRVSRHEGKLYNFDFDFFSSDKLVCSEVIYRAYDGLGGITFPLVERAGRHTLSPENIVEYALTSDALEVAGIYGVDKSRTQYIRGRSAKQVAIASISA